MNAMESSFESEADRILADLKRELSGVRTNRPSAALVEGIVVDYYGQQTPLKHMSSVSIALPREINIQVWDKGAVSAVAKAVETSTLKLSPQVQGNVVRIHLPELSAERRAEFIKHVKKTAEDYRIRLRHARDEANRKTQGDVALTEDDKFSEKERVQRAVDKTNDGIEKALEAKIKEIKS